MPKFKYLVYESVEDKAPVYFNVVNHPTAHSLQRECDLALEEALKKKGLSQEDAEHWVVRIIETLADGSEKIIEL